MHYLIGLIIPFISFFIQSYPRFFNKYFGVDVWTRMIEIEHIRKAGHKIPNKITKGFIIDGYFDYPPIFPFLFSFLSKKTLLAIQGYIAPFFDVLQNILIFILTFTLTQNITAALLAQLIYTSIPMIAVENTSLSPRSLGYLNFTLAFYPLLVYSINHEIIFLILGFIFTCALFLSHRFALQSFIFISIFFSIIDRSFLYIACLTASFATVIFLTKGYYLRVARGHLSNIYFWVINYEYRFAHQIYGNQKNKKLDWVGKIYSYLSYFSPIFLFGIDIWIISAFIYTYFYYSSPISNEIIYYKMSLWIIFFYLLGALVLRIKKLVPIGEGQRYLEMTTVPSSILSSILFLYFFNIYGTIILILFILAIIANFLIIITIQIKGVLKDKNRSLTPDLKKAFSFINKLSKTPRIICIPHQMTTMTVYNTKADVLVNADNPGLMKITDFFPVLKKSIKELAKNYNLDYLLLKESFVNLEELKISKAKVVFKSGDILLIKL